MLHGMRTSRALRAAAAFLVLLGWVVLLRGLHLSPSPRPELDLEAGPAFGTTVEVYLPAIGLTAILVVLLPVGLLARRLWPAAALTAACLAGAFGLWVLTRSELLAHLPGLKGHLVAHTVLSAAALVLAGTAAMSARAASPRPGRVPVTSG